MYKGAADRCLLQPCLGALGLCVGCPCWGDGPWLPVSWGWLCCHTQGCPLSQWEGLGENGLGRMAMHSGVLWGLLAWEWGGVVPMACSTYPCTGPRACSWNTKYGDFVPQADKGLNGDAGGALLQLLMAQGQSLRWLSGLGWGTMSHIPQETTSGVKNVEDLGESTQKLVSSYLTTNMDWNLVTAPFWGFRHNTSLLHLCSDTTPEVWVPSDTQQQVEVREQALAHPAGHPSWALWLFWPWAALPPLRIVLHLLYKDWTQGRNKEEGTS